MRGLSSSGGTRDEEASRRHGRHFKKSSPDVGALDGTRLSAGEGAPLGIAGVLALVGVGVSSLFLCAILFLSVAFTALFDTPGYESFTLVSWVSDERLLPIAGVMCAVLFGVALAAAYKAGTLAHERIFLGLSVVIPLGFGVWWVFSADSVLNLFPDSANLVYYARGVLAEGWGGFAESSYGGAQSAGAYFENFPFQSGVFWLVYYVSALFPAHDVMVLQFMNVGANLVTLLCLYALGRKVLKAPEARSVLSILEALCFPLICSVTLPYGNHIGLALGCCFLVFQARAMQCCEREGGMHASVLLNVAISLPFLVLTLIMKSTFVLYAIAALIVWCLVALRRHRVTGLLATLAALLVANCLSGLPVAALEDEAGMEFGDGMPKLSWILMGLNNSDLTGMPGWWDTEAYDIFQEAPDSVSEQGEIAASRIAAQVAEWVEDPLDALRFFARKLVTEWAEPSFESLYYSSLCIRDDGSYFDAYAALGQEFPARLSTALLDGYQMVVYAGALAAAVSMLRRRQWIDCTRLLLVSVFFSGFGCYLLWEAKSIYTLPFFVLLLPLSARGIAVLLAKLSPGVHCRSAS